MDHQIDDELKMLIVKEITDKMSASLDRAVDSMCRGIADGMLSQAKSFFTENKDELITAIGASIAKIWCEAKKHDK